MWNIQTIALYAKSGHQTATAQSAGIGFSESVEPYEVWSLESGEWSCLELGVVFSPKLRSYPKLFINSVRNGRLAKSF